MDKRPSLGSVIVPSVTESLVEFDHTGRLVARLASSWQWRDERTLVMTLRQRVTFHNGEAFDAAMVKRNWDEHRRLRESLGADWAWWTFPPEVRLEVVDPYTVRLAFPEPDNQALVKLSATPMMNRQFWREAGAVAEGYYVVWFSVGP